MERYEGDILVGSSDLSNPSTLSAHLANPDKLWPSGVVEYKFYKTFPRFLYEAYFLHSLTFTFIFYQFFCSNQREKMREAMDLITNRVPCITFELATPESVNFVTIVNGADCSSDLGMKGGEQHI